MNLPDIRFISKEQHELLFELDHRHEALEEQVMQNSFSNIKAALELGAEVVAAFDNKNLAGHGVISLEKNSGPVHIVELYVKSDYRMSGIAKSLFLSMLDRASAAGADTIYATVRPIDVIIAFYRSQGFQEIETCQAHPDDPSENLVYLRKKIKRRSGFGF